MNLTIADLDAAAYALRLAAHKCKRRALLDAKHDPKAALACEEKAVRLNRVAAVLEDAMKRKGTVKGVSP